MKEYKHELNQIISEYQNVHEKLNTLEKQLSQQMSIHNSLKNRLDEIREREKEIINNIEEETGEKMNASKIMSLL